MSARPSPSATAAPRPASGFDPPETERLRTNASPIEYWLSTGEQRAVAFELTVGRWGVLAAGPAIVRAHDRLGAFTLERPLGGAPELRAYPRVDRLHRLVAPLRSRPVLGSQVSRERGEGIEFADLRPLIPGDRVRSINWRASARRGVPYVNLQHPEHSADIVLFLDTFAEAERAEAGTLDAAVHAAAALASTYLTQRDRVALVSFGGVLSWLVGSPGTRQLYRIVDALLESHVKPSFRWTDITHVPGHLLPARALVIALSPLLDERSIGALLDLRARGYDLVVVEISPLAPGDAGFRRTAAAALAAPARNAARTLRAARRAGRALGAPVHRSRPRDRGGDRVPPARTSRPARLATAAGSLAVAAGLGAAAALEADSHAPALAVAAAAIACLALGLSTRRSEAIPIALLLLGALHVISDGDRSIGTVIYGSGLLLTAELAYWSIDEHGRRPVEPGVFAPRLLAILAVVAAGDPRERAGARGRRHRHIALARVDGRRSNRNRGVCRPPRGDGASAREFVRRLPPGARLNLRPPGSGPGAEHPRGLRTAR